MNYKIYLDFFMFLLYFLICIGFGFYIGLLNYNNIYKQEYFDIIKINNSSVINKNNSEIRKIYIKQFYNSNIYFSDLYYNIIELQTIKKILEIDNTNNLPYILKNEINDCDDFSIILGGNLKKLKYKYKNIYVNLPIGIAFGLDNKEQGHSFNLILSYNKNITDFYFYCIEPQNDEIFDCNKKKYKINNVYF